MTIIGPECFFEKAYVINLESRKDRYQQFDEMSKRANIGEIERLEAVSIPSNPALGCAESHLEVIRRAKAQKIKNVVIFEDDALPVDNFNEIIREAIVQLASLPGWDLFYFGGHLRAPAKRVTPNLAKMTGAWCTHAYAVNESMYDKILEYDLNKCPVIDVYYSSIMSDFNSYTCYPISIHQRPSKSDLVSTFVDYRELFQRSYDEYIQK